MQLRQTSRLQAELGYKAYAFFNYTPFFPSKSARRPCKQAPKITTMANNIRCLVSKACRPTPFTSASSPCVAAPLCLNGPPGSTVLRPLHGGPSSPSWTFLSRAQGTECQADWRCRTLAAHWPGSGPSQLASTVTGTGRPSLSTVTSQWLEREQHQSLPRSVSLGTEVPPPDDVASLQPRAPRLCCCARMSSQRQAGPGMVGSEPGPP